MNKIGYPVFDRSVKNYVFEPRPDLPLDHYKNKNRRDWTEEELHQLAIDAFGVDEFYPTTMYMAVVEVDLKDSSKHGIVDTNLNMYDKWLIGRIIRLGEHCFDTREFPPEAGGASATINDYIKINPMNVTRTKYPKGNLLVMKDVNITGTVPNPRNCVNG